MRKFKKPLLVTLFLIVVACIFAGCGANISTEMTIGDGFSGQRVINVKFDSSDLDEYVTGGIDELKKIADENLPSELTYTLTSDDTTSTMSFVLAFSDIDDYKTKVNSLISKGSNTELTPEIIYESGDTPFKQGLKFQENFTSFDLLQWYFDAVKSAGIVTHEDESEWYELGENYIITSDGEKEYSYSELSISKQDNNCLDSIDVETTVNMDGTFKRVFTFRAYESTVEDLSKNGCVLSTYLSDLTPENDTFEENTETSPYEYKITVTAADMQQLVDKTNSILQTENSFSYEIKNDTQTPGTALITLTEKLDGSYYLDYSYSSSLESKVNLFNNISFADDSGEDAYLEDSGFSYYPSSANEYTYNIKWKISFESVEMQPEVNGDKLNVKFIFTLGDILADDLKTSAVDALKASAESFGKFNQTDNGCELEFSGKTEEVISQINEFVRKNDENPSEENIYFSITNGELQTGTKFTNGVTGSISYDLSPIIGDTYVIFNDKEGLLADYYYSGDMQTDENGNRVLSSNAYVQFTVVKVSILTVVLTVVFAVILIAGILLAVIFRKELKAIADSFSKKNTAAVPYTISDEQKTYTDDIIIDEEEENTPSESENTQCQTVAATVSAPAEPDKTDSDTDDDEAEEELL